MVSLVGYKKIELEMEENHATFQSSSFYMLI